jgi:outer membrane receptor protein involved in Fe transport
LFSDGTIFNEAPEGGEFQRIEINEYGGYVQLSKTLKRDDYDALILTGSLRYDKNENFDGQTTPRISAVYSPAKNHHIRASFQTGFRNPDTQAQFIFFNVGTNILLGSTEANAARYGVHNGGAWTFDSYQTGDPAQYQTANIPYVKPEQLKAFEIGYKVTSPKVLIDLNYYYTDYTDFIGGTYIVSKEASVQRGVTLPAGTVFSPYYNSPAKINSSGVGVGLTYNLPFKGYQLLANYNYAQFSQDKGQDPNFRANFNTPEHKYNVGLNYYESSNNFSFNINYRWQDELLWESDFGIGPIASYGVFDVQTSYRLAAMKSTIKLGANNLFGGDYRTNFGGPFVGQVYYLSITFDPNQFTK